MALNNARAQHQDWFFCVDKYLRRSIIQALLLIEQNFSLCIYNVFCLSNFSVFLSYLWFICSNEGLAVFPGVCNLFICVFMQLTQDIAFIVVARKRSTPVRAFIVIIKTTFFRSELSVSCENSLESELKPRSLESESAWWSQSTSKKQWFIWMLWKLS